jgi:uncharacterized protein YndB with AHSA1/START domain
MSAELKKDGSIELTIEREFPYPPKQVFEAWLIPEKVAIWMGHSDEMQAQDVMINAYEGGSYSMTFPNEDGSTLKLHGVYQKIQPYTHLSFSWIWDPAMDEDHNETLVSVDLTPTEAGTKLTLMHTRFGSEEMCDCHRHGWAGTLDKFTRRLNRIFTPNNIDGDNQ